ncbi:MAG TPA: PHB depolymerase family esterase [Gemmatimonadales bacterium]
MTSRRGMSLAAAAMLVGMPALGQQLQTGFLNRTIVDGKVTRRYQVYVPADYTAEKRWPVILFLHGGGAQGDDGLVQTEGAVGSAIRRSPARWPAIVLFPQVRPGRRWSGDDARWALEALEATEREFATDSTRIYLTGLSRGGAGAWYLAYRNPARFAAVLIACGGVPSEAGPVDSVASRLRSTPVWVWQGEADELVPVAEARRIVAALKQAEAPVTYTELPRVGHNVWDLMYDSPKVIQWLFAQRAP